MFSNNVRILLRLTTINPPFLLSSTTHKSCATLAFFPHIIHLKQKLLTRQIAINAYLSSN